MRSSCVFAFLFLAAASLVFLGGSTAEAKGNNFLGEETVKVADYLSGRWGVEVFRTSVRLAAETVPEHADEPDEPDVDMMNEMNDAHSVGQFAFEKITEYAADGSFSVGTEPTEMDLLHKYRIELDAEDGGIFKIAGGDASEDDDEAYEVLFHFHFERTPEGRFLSTGSHGALSYVFALTHNERFVLKLVEKKAEEVLSTTLTAVRIQEQQQRSFMQKYGMIIMMMGFMLVSQYFKQRQAAPAPPVADAQATAGTTTAAGATPAAEGSTSAETTSSSSGKKDDQ